MKAISFVEKGKAAFVVDPDPECTVDSVLLKTLYSGMTNGTERNVMMGGNYGGTWPARCGYQLVSRVVERGSQISRFEVGDIVYTGTFPGHVAYHTARESDLIVKLPDGFDLEEAALLGVASVPMHDARRAAVGIDDKVLVIGAGLIGLAATQVARAMGADVTVIDVDDDRLALARLVGADRVFNNSHASGQKDVQDNGPYSVIIECSGADVFPRIMGTDGQPRLIDFRGRVLIIAGRDDVRYSFNSGQGSEVAMLHAGHFVQTDLEHVVRLVNRQTIRLRPLIKDTVPIDEAIPRYNTLRDEPNRLLGTIFVWD